jgi:hypothetical protein
MTFPGTAGQIRELMRAAIHLLAPDGDVQQHAWFEGNENGRPTQAELIRHAAQSQSGAEPTIDAADVIETKVARFGRQLY